MSRKFTETLILCAILSACIAVLYFHKKQTLNKQHQSSAAVHRDFGSEEESEGLANLEDRAKWEFSRLKDPMTGKIPPNIRWKELEFAKTLPKARNYGLKSVQWINRGPYNVGGRTRGIAVDVDNENVIIAGGVSGGIWRSTNGGQSWNEQTAADQLHSVSCIAQDVRPGKRNIWYYGTGEVYGNSASTTGAYFLGNGMFKSLDSGKTWQSIPSTASNTPQSLSNFWDLIWNIGLDPSKMDSDVVYAASLGTIYMSIDGGDTWKTVLGGGNNYSIYADLAVTSKGVVYATLGKETSNQTNGGIYRSIDGVHWTNITPPGFPSIFYRIVIGINPSNENEVYFVGVTQSQGVFVHAYYGYTAWQTLWRYKYLGGDGAGANGQWTDLSKNLPVYSNKVFNNFYTQGSYDMVIRVKPGDSNVVFLGGTNVYRSDDAFNSPDSTVQIGGYEINTELPDFQLYKNHHPDQHNFVFLPSDPNVLITANDGGVYRTNNDMANVVEWDKLDNGYSTTQLYTVSIDEKTTSNTIVAGFQDNGNFFTSSTDPKAIWTMPLNGDGAFSAITKGGKYYYLSIQEGKTYKMTLDSSGHRLKFSRIDPIGGSDYLFVNPFVVDPNDSNIMYMAGGRNLWRNDSLTYLPMNDTYDSISKGWYKFPYTLPGPDTSVTALAISTNPPNILYYGTNCKKVYRVDNANTEHSTRTDVTSNYFPISGNQEGGNVSCIAVDPDDANKVVVVFSNYNVYSLFYSTDGGKTWKLVGGNLEQSLSGAGDGPSCRWLNIMTFPHGKRIYLLGTSTGLYATDTLINETDSTHTEWVQVGADVIGNVVVDMVKSRPTDNLVVVATHGSGVFSTHINSFNDIESVFNITRDNGAQIKLFPNPSSAYTNVSIYLTRSETGNVYIYNRSGRLVKTYNSVRFGNSNEMLRINTSDLTNGIYYCVVNLENRKLSKAFIVMR